jgi:large conductance mechanosensitive channel
MSLVQEFKTFAMRGNAIDLAVGVVVGAAFSTIELARQGHHHSALGSGVGRHRFFQFFPTLKGNSFPTLAASDAGAVTLNYGLFLNAVINFIIVAFARSWWCGKSTG